MNRESERKRLVEQISECCAKNLNMVQLLEFEKLLLADHLLDNGIVVPPVKVGDKVYKPWKAGGRDVVADCVVVAIISAIRDDWCIKYKKVGGTICYQAVISDIGKTVFASREEAEQKLKGGEDNE